MADRVGDVLRAERESRGLDLAEVAGRTRVPTRHLVAIETGSYEGLPAATYSAGFVKTYARLLGLDGQRLSQQFRDELAASDPVPARREIYEPADPARTPSRGLAWTAFAAAIILAIGFLYWHGTRLTDNPRELAAAAPAEGSATPPVRAAAARMPAPAQAAGGATVIGAESAVWLKIYEKGGATLFMGVLDPGKSFTVPANATDPRLQTARANALHVTVGTSLIPALGPAERLVKDVSLKPDALLARISPADPPASTAPPGMATGPASRAR